MYVLAVGAASTSTAAVDLSFPSFLVRRMTSTDFVPWIRKELSGVPPVLVLRFDD
jgi:hypothetical protein